MRIGSWKILATLTGRRIEPYADIRADDQRVIKSAELDTFELYNLDDDPFEMHNLIDDPSHEDIVKSLTHYAWSVIRDTGDRALLNSHYPILRLAPFGPDILEG